MDKNGVRIISLEASEIYQQIYNNGEAIGYILPKKKSEAYFALFKNVLDYSLDSIELAEVYKKLCRHEFSFEDENKNEYTLAVINLKFNRAVYEKNDVVLKNCKALREYFYDNGFVLDGRKYVRYKRSAGSSRAGKCLFIDERLLKYMEKWGECGLKAENGGLASWEAYKALSLSSIKGTIEIPLDGILVIPDCKSVFTEKVVKVSLKKPKKEEEEEKDTKEVSVKAKKKKSDRCTEGTNAEEEKKVLIASTDKATIETDIWDGESLLDDSLFVKHYPKRHMLLLRNKFFKTCAFRTRLKKWFEDKNITLEDLKNRGFVTLATNIDQIVMVTTPNSMKFLKFMKGGITEKKLRKWAEQVESKFGVVKYDKRTRFFGGEMVQSSYQFINTLGFTEEQAEELLEPSKNYLTKIRTDYDFMRYHFTDAYKREKEDDVKEKFDTREELENIFDIMEDIEAGEEPEEGREEIADGLAERSDVIFKLMEVNPEFQKTRLYADFRNDVVKSQKDRLKKGHILLRGTNATLFGNGPEMLLALAGEFNLRKKKNAPVVLQPGEIACGRFQHGERLVGARSPHVTMGNIYCVTNNLNHDIWNYFDLGENIVCVNAIKENIQHRLNGCEYDSDTMLITNDKLVVETAFQQKDHFLVPVCDIKSKNNANEVLSELDHNTSQNKVGEIINLSQRLNTTLWDRLSSECAYKDNKKEQGLAQELYEDICKLAVLSGIEIDKAKRAFDDINIAMECGKISTKPTSYKVDENKKPMFPEFFKEIGQNREDQKRKKKDKQGVDQEQKLEADKQESNQGRKYAFYHAPMEYIYKSAKKIDFRRGRVGNQDYQPISAMLVRPKGEGQTVSTVYDRKNRIIEICEEYKIKLNGEYIKLRNAKDDDEKELIYENIKQMKSERNAKVAKKLTEKLVLYLVIQELDNGEKESENWHLYAPLLQNEMFKDMLIKSTKKMYTVTKKADGEIDLYGLKFTKI